MFTRIVKSMFGKAALAAAVLGGALCFVGAPKAQADERDRFVRRGDYRREAFEHRRYDRDNYRFERRPYVRGWYDRFGYRHRY